MNLRKILLAGLLCGTMLGAMAIPAKRDIRTFRQSDGTEIAVRLVGDEHFHSFVTIDGLAVEKNSTGDFFYVTSDGVSNVMAHNPQIRKAAELSYIEREGSKLSVKAIAEKQMDAINARRARKVATRSAQTQVPNNGSPKIPILLVQYKDKKFKDADPLATFNNFFVNGSVSASRYFQDQSNGKYNPQFDVYGPVTLTNNRSYYGGNIGGVQGNDRATGQMVAEAALALDNEIDFTQYDNDGDGECDVLIVLYAGDGEASSYDYDAANSIWPCQWELSSSDYRRALYLDETMVDKFAVFNELNGSNLSKIDGIGTFCHEFSHCLGLPDFYDTTYGNHFGMGPWSLMDYGSYNNDSYTPIGYSAYEKEFMGWIETEEGTEDTLYKLPVFNAKSIDTDKAIRLTSGTDKNEYFILENRQQQGWDKYMVAEGLFIYHVTFSQSAWDGNTVNNYNPQRMIPVPADNSLKMDSYYGQYTFNEKDLLGDLWPYNGNNEFTDTSKPAQKLSNGKLLGKPVTEITKNSDGTISFWLMRSDREMLSTPVFGDHSVISPTSATINWESGLENDATFNLELREYEEYAGPSLAVSTVFDNTEHGWEVTGYTIIEQDALRLGSGSQLGTAISPLFTDGEDGVVSVKFTAKNYNMDESNVVVQILDENNKVISKQTLALDTEYKDYTVILEGKKNTKLSVSIGTEAKKKRIFLKSADIYDGAYSSDTRAASNVVTITGIEGTSHTLTDLIHGGKYEYRIKAIPRNPDAYRESEWSERKMLDLSNAQGSGIEAIGSDNTPFEYYTLQGMRIAKPILPGIYIVKKGFKTYKISI